MAGRTVTSWPSLQTDLRNAGAYWVDREVVVCRQGINTLVTSRKPEDLGRRSATRCWQPSPRPGCSFELSFAAGPLSDHLREPARHIAADDRGGSVARARLVVAPAWQKPNGSTRTDATSLVSFATRVTAPGERRGTDENPSATVGVASCLQRSLWWAFGRRGGRNRGHRRCCGRGIDGVTLEPELRLADSG